MKYLLFIFSFNFYYLSYSQNHDSSGFIFNTIRFEINQPAFTSYSGNKFYGWGIQGQHVFSNKSKSQFIFGMGFSTSKSFIGELSYGPNYEYEIYQKLNWVSINPGIRYFPGSTNFFIETFAQFNLLISAKLNGKYEFSHNFLGGYSHGSGTFEDKPDVVGIKVSGLLNIGYRFQINAHELFFSFGYSQGFSKVTVFRSTLELKHGENLINFSTGFTF